MKNTTPTCIPILLVSLLGCFLPFVCWFVDSVDEITPFELLPSQLLCLGQRLWPYPLASP